MNSNTWYNLKLRESMKDEFIKKFPQFDFDNCMKIASEGNLHDFSLLCTMIEIASYDGSYFTCDWDTFKLLREACNKRVNNILGEDNTRLYNMFLKSQKHELWAGDERYKLFAYAFAPTNDRQVIKSVVIANHYLKSEMSIELFEKIGKLYCTPLTPDLYVEKYLFKDFISFKKKNEDRQMHVSLWIKFMEHIWFGRYEKAYEIIKNYECTK